MRILIFANDDLTSNLIFSKLFNVNGVEVAGIAFTRSYTRGRVGYSGALSLLKIMDLRYWVFLVFTVSGFKLKELFSRIRCDDTVPSLKAHAKRNNIPVLYSSDFNSEKDIAAVKKLNPDLIVIRIDQILQKKILEMPRYGVICVHSSLLPSYKGIAGEFHAMRNDERVAGVSVFQVQERLDAGDILGQSWFEIDKNKSLFHHIVANNDSGGELLRELVLSMDEDGKFNGQHYPESLEASYYSWPSKSDVESFKRSGGRLIGLKGIFVYCRWVFSIRQKLTDIL